jgi:excisionase family DNA binding protein
MGMANKPEPAMSVHDVAAYLNVDEKTIYRLAQRGELPGFKVAGAWRFQRHDLQRWIEQRKRRSPARARTNGDGGSR